MVRPSIRPDIGASSSFFLVPADGPYQVVRKVRFLLRPFGVAATSWTARSGHQRVPIEGAQSVFSGMPLSHVADADSPAGLLFYRAPPLLNSPDEVDFPPLSQERENEEGPGWTSGSASP